MLSPLPQGAPQSARAGKERSREERGYSAVIIWLDTVPRRTQAYVSTCIVGRRTPDKRVRWAFRPVGFDSLLARLTDRNSVQTRQEACVVPRNHPVEQLGVGYSQETSPEIGDFWCANESPRDSSTLMETALPMDTPVSAKCVHQTPSGGLSDAV